MGRARVELATSRLSGVRSNHLSYRPTCHHSNVVLSRPAAQKPQGDPHSAAGRQGRSGRCCSMRCSNLQLMKGHEDDGIFSEKDWKHHDDQRSSAVRSVLRKEVIQPQVPLRLPCYDFTPVADPTVVSCLLAVSALPSGETNSHGVTGGVYKAWERIHRGMLIRDY